MLLLTLSRILSHRAAFLRAIDDGSLRVSPHLSLLRRGTTCSKRLVIGDTTLTRFCTAARVFLRFICELLLNFLVTLVILSVTKRRIMFLLEVFCLGVAFLNSTLTAILSLGLIQVVYAALQVSYRSSGTSCPLAI